MKAVFLITSVVMMMLQNPAPAQSPVLDQRFAFNINNQGLEQAISLIEKTAGISIAYDAVQVDKKRVVNVPSINLTLKNALYAVFGQGFEFLMVGNRVIVRVRPKQQGKFSLYGYITDSYSGETLPGASVYLSDDVTIGTVSNHYGYFSLSLSEGKNQIIVSYIGYEPLKISVEMNDNRRFDFKLDQISSALEEIVVVGEKEKVGDLSIGALNLDIKSVKVMPSLAGEPDPIKLLQLTPGVKSGGEGSSGLFVRGGNLDQNLILLDDAPVYNPTHLLGFFSVFNADALKRIDMFKGHIPIEYGDRLASVVDIRMRDGNKGKFGAEGGIGLLATRVLVEGPIEKDKASFVASFRRSYPDIFLNLSSSGGGNKVNFTDGNVKLNFKLTDKDNIFLSGYYGEDNLRFFDQYENTWGNYTTSLRWNHLFGKNLFGNLVAYRSNYRYNIGTFVNGQSTIDWTSSISEYAAKYDWSLFINSGHLIKFGSSAIWRDYAPGKERSGLIQNIPSKEVLEFVGYIGHDWKVSDNFELKYGLRYNVFQNRGEDEMINTLSPRFNVKYHIDSRSSLEASYNRHVQFQHEIRNAASPFNAFYVWLPSGLNLPHGISDQFTLGYKRTFNNACNLTIEGYYKSLQNQIDYADHASIIQNSLIEQDLRVGEGRAYGFETQIEKNDGRLTGWVQYTFSRSLRTIDGINNGMEYPAFFDQPHSISILAQYALSKRTGLVINWQYATGQPVNLPIGTFQSDDTLIPLYSGRNNGRLPDFHRLDLSYTLQRKPGQWKNESYWVFSLINVYFRKNALSLDYLPNRDKITGNIVDPLDKRVFKTYVFGLIPSVSWNFKF